mmetsp:Transcript_16813/g.37811  ORF Transcript_16813/g.37811 Transcript_16813/m.37811 type:complete len:95 (+) Transcript_16813:196-480(+)
MIGVLLWVSVGVARCGLQGGSGRAVGSDGIPFWLCWLVGTGSPVYPIEKDDTTSVGVDRPLTCVVFLIVDALYCLAQQESHVMYTTPFVLEYHN